MASRSKPLFKLDKVNNSSSMGSSFVDNCRSPNRESGELKAEEIEDAAIQVMKGAQRKAYPD